MGTAVIVTDLSDVTQCDSLTADGLWTGGVADVLGTTDPAPLEPTGWVGGVIKKSGDDMIFTPTTPLDMSGTHLRWIWNTILKANLLTLANSGVFFVITGSTSGVATFKVSGTDKYVGGWEVIVLNPYGTPDSGTPVVGNIVSIQIDVTIGTAAKNVVTTQFDYITYGNGMYVHGGTSGDEIGMVEIDAQDTFYLMSNKIKGVYELTGKFQLGDSTGTNTTYFKDSGKILIFQDLLVDDDYYEFNVAGNSTGTTVIDFTGMILSSVSKPYSIDMTDSTNVTSIDISGSTIQLAGSGIALSSVVTGEGTVFDACGPIDPGGAVLDGVTIKNSSAVGTTEGSLVINVDTEAHACDNMKFQGYEGATTYAIFVDSSVTSFTMDNWVFDDPDNTTSYALYWEGAAGTLTISATNGTNLVTAGCTSAGGTVVVTSSVDITVTVKDKDTRAVIENVQTSVYLLNSPYTQLMNEDTNASGIATESYGGSTPVDVMVRTRKSEDTDDPRYKPESSIQEITSSGLTLTVSMKENTILA